MAIAYPPVELAGPSHLDLPHTDDKPVENAFQPLQSSLLSGSLAPWLDRLHPDGNYFVGADCGIYWLMAKPPEDGCKAPDWFYVANVPRLLDGEIRRSYVMWREVVSPLVVVEYVSGTGAEEKDEAPFRGKFWVYERAIKAPYYVIWDAQRATLEAFELVRMRYHPMDPNERGRFWIPPLELEFGAWEGDYQGTPGTWLRTWTDRGLLIPTPEESLEAQRQLTHAERQRAEAEKQRAETEKQRAETERLRAERLTAKLRELGLDPDAV